LTLIFVGLFLFRSGRVPSVSPGDTTFLYGNGAGRPHFFLSFPLLVDPLKNDLIILEIT